MLSSFRCSTSCQTKFCSEAHQFHLLSTVKLVWCNETWLWTSFCDEKHVAKGSCRTCCTTKREHPKHSCNDVIGRKNCVEKGCVRTEWKLSCLIRFSFGRERENAELLWKVLYFLFLDIKTEVCSFESAGNDIKGAQVHLANLRAEMQLIFIMRRQL